MADEPQEIPSAQDDASHIRTYAKDVAVLTGKPLPKNVQNVPAPARPQKVPEPPPARIIPKAPSTNESREDVLARLKAKAAGTSTAPTAPAPQPVDTSAAREAVLARLKNKKAAAPVPPPKPAPAPVPAPPPPPPAPRPQPTAPPGIPPVSKTAAPSPVHTYKSDFADHTKKQGATPLSVLAAEGDARGRPAPKPIPVKRKSPLLPVLAGAALMVAGGTVLYLAWTFVTDRPMVPIEPFVPSLIFADERVRLEGAGTDLQQKLYDLRDLGLPEGGVAIAYVTYATTTAEGETVELPAAGSALVQALELPAPDILLRNTGDASTVGAVRSGETYPFLILRVDSFERTFAGMLAWEDTMADDLSILFPAFIDEIATTTATSTAVTVAPGFVDETIANHDARVLYDGKGRSILLYGYRDPETLIIARDADAFTELLSRLAATRAQ